MKTGGILRVGVTFGRAFVVVCALLLAAPAAAQTIANGDFEDGLRGWSASGPAFQSQPVVAASVTIEVVRPVPLGGTYWRDLPYPLGQGGRFLIRSAAGTGTLTSDAFTLASDDRFLSLRIAGTTNPNLGRFELQVAPVAARAGDSQVDYRPIWYTMGRGPAQLQQEVFQIPSGLAGRLARLVVVDDAPGSASTIAVDSIALSATAPPPLRQPIWGLGDYHSHPQNYMAFGGLNGVRTVWGVPGSAYRDYEFIPDLIERDIPACAPRHFGGLGAEFVVDQVEGRLDVTSGSTLAKLIDVLKHGLSHGAHGPRDFKDYPSFTSGLHYQMHVTQVHRAWEGGLRLLTAIAIHNQGVEFLASQLVFGGVNPSRERAVLDAQVCGMRQLAALNHEWMEIAYSPLQARDIISRGKLAVVLGAEFDQLGQLDGFDSQEDEVQYLWDIGIRQVTPIHAIDNRLGGAAVFQPVYNWLNDLLNRGTFNVQEADLRGVPTVFFDVRSGDCATTPHPGECVLYTLSDEQNRAAIVKSLGPFIVPVTKKWDVVGMLNQKGLTVAGGSYLRSLMKRGMLAGIEHMSQQSVEDTYAVLGQDLARRGRPECTALGQPGVPESCYADAYPLEFSHAHLRRMSLQRRGDTPVEGYLPSEYEMSDREAEFLRRTGGFVGHFVADDPVEPPDDLALPFKNDCGGSSKTFATSLLYALHLFNWTGVGLATDFTIIEGTAPRFGKRACWGARDDIAGKNHPSPVPGQYGRKQEDPVVYRGLSGGAEALEPYRMGKRVYDFNQDGLAHYGMLPDFLEDLHNIGLPREAFVALFSSAEGYVQTWEKAERLAGIPPRPFVPLPLPCEIVCRGLCPQSANAGAPPAQRH